MAHASRTISRPFGTATMLALGTLLILVLTFVAALISGIGVLTALAIVAVMTAALLVLHLRSGRRGVRS